jgi:hypothetical protein
MKVSKKREIHWQTAVRTPGCEEDLEKATGEPLCDPPPDQGAREKVESHEELLKSAHVATFIVGGGDFPTL